MMQFSLSAFAALGLAAFTALGLVAPPVDAQTTTLTPADSHVGAAGPAGGSNPDGNGGFYGNSGLPGYFLNSNPNLIVNGPTLTGGAGGEVTGSKAATNYAGGSGGSGLSVGRGTATINSGTFNGGAGGAADGVGNNLIGGAGGDGFYAGNSTASIYDGTFQGGNSGPVSATGTPESYAAGNGLNANNGSVINVYGGSFTGGNDNQNSYYAHYNFGLADFGGNVNIYGGTFASGTNGDAALGAFGGTTTLYGSDFSVNGVAASSGPLTGSGTITGKLADNAGMSTITYDVLFNGSLNLDAAPVPEASTTVSLGLLLALGLGGVMAAGRRKKRTA